MIGEKGPGVMCPDCRGPSRVSRTTRDEMRGALRRRRDCIRCGLRFTTSETVVADSAVSGSMRRAAEDVARRYMTLSYLGRRAMNATLLAIEEAAKLGAAYEAGVVREEAHAFEVPRPAATMRPAPRSSEGRAA